MQDSLDLMAAESTPMVNQLMSFSPAQH